MYVCIRMYVFVYMYMYVRICMCVCICMSVCMYVSMHTCIYIYAYYIGESSGGNVLPKMGGGIVRRELSYTRFI